METQNQPVACQCSGVLKGITVACAVLAVVLPWFGMMAALIGILLAVVSIVCAIIAVCKKATMFGIIMIVNLEIGFLTPPVGLNLLVAMSVFKRKFGELVAAAVPFIALMLGCLAVIAWQPWISLSLLGR